MLCTPSLSRSHGHGAAVLSHASAVPFWLLSAQLVPGPFQSPPTMLQSACVKTTQLFVAGIQHAPVGCGQFAVPQFVPLPWKLPPAAEQFSGEVGPKHVPSGKQHAPVGKQTVCAHVVPLPWKTPPTVLQITCDALLRQFPVAMMQHPPLGSGPLASSQQTL